MPLVFVVHPSTPVNNLTELLAWIKAKGWTPIASPQLARYDPPWTLPFLRRNEILVELGLAARGAP